MNEEVTKISIYWLKVLVQHLSGDLCKSGPGYFALEKSFPSNFDQ